MFSTARVFAAAFLHICISAVIFAGAAGAQTPLKVEKVADTLGLPSGAFHAPGDPTRLHILEQPGTIRILKNGNLLPVPFLDITTKTLLGPEQGLLGLAFHPNYKANGRFFIYYTRVPDGAVVIEEYLATSNPDIADPGSNTVYLTIPQPFDNHNGGTLAFSPVDGLLYIAPGDGGSGGDPFDSAQNIQSLLGKMLRINVDATDPGLPYRIPHTNPFKGATPGLDEIFDIGLRNPWRFSFDRQTGDMYIGDVGQEHFEEVNFKAAGAPGGANFGWDCKEGFNCAPYGGGASCNCTNPALVDPIHVYNHPTGCAIIGGHVYRGCNIPDLNGRYFFADLCTNKIWSFRYNGSTLTDFTNHSTELAPPLFSNSVVSFAEDANGELYIIYQSGQVGKIVAANGIIPGVQYYGTSDAGCAGPHSIFVNCSPRVGMEAFQIGATNGPAGSLALGLVTDAQGGGSDTFSLGIGMWVDLPASTETFALDMPIDENGVASVVFDIPNSPAIVGNSYYGQALFYWSPGCSATAPLGFSGSNAVALTLQ